MKSRKRQQPEATIPEQPPRKADASESEGEEDWEDNLTFDRTKSEYEDHEHEEDREDAEEDQKSEADFDAVDADFALADPSEVDFHGLRALMQSSRVCQVTGIAVSSITNFICNQGNIGSVVKPENDENDENDEEEHPDEGDKGKAAEGVAARDAKSEVGYTNLFGAISVVNLRQDKAFSVALGRLADLARKHVKDEEKKKYILKLLSAPEEGKATGKAKKQEAAPAGSLGLLINERMPNLPPILLPLMHQSLVDDFAWSLSTPECPEDERAFYKLEHLVFIGLCHFDNSGALGTSSMASPKKKVKNAGGKAAPAEGSYVYGQPELEIYADRAETVFFYPTAAKGLYQSRDRQKSAMLPEYTMVAFLNFKSLQEIAKDLRKLFPVDGRSKVESLTT